jgi:hypothetical protein
MTRDENPGPARATIVTGDPAPMVVAATVVIIAPVMMIAAFTDDDEAVCGIKSVRQITLQKRSNGVRFIEDLAGAIFGGPLGSVNR